MKSTYRHLILNIIFLVLPGAVMQAQRVGEVLPPWQEGQLDIHHINTGRGNAAFYVLPDGTTLLVDAGALDPTDSRTQSPRNTPATPNATRQPGEWIARYIQKAIPPPSALVLDYALLTHFHDDHIGTPFKGSKVAAGGHKLTGITEVGEHVKIRTLLDRGWPDYTYPRPMDNEMMNNYRQFLTWQRQHNQMQVERFQPGRNDQIGLKHTPELYASLFEIRNITVNGEIWTGVGTVTRQHFPRLTDVAPEQYPHENMCSIAFRLSYGKFDYFTGGDLPGILFPGQPPWYDVETPVAKAVGPVDVHVLNHHGNRDSQNEFLLAALRPRVFIIPVWSSDHPGHDVLSRIVSNHVYSGQRDVFATDMLEANKLVIGELLDQLKSSQGHIVVRVAAGGETYRVFILEDGDESFRIKAIHGPYHAR